MTTATVSPPSKAVRIGPDGLPERTLGWQILGWIDDMLLQPDGPDAGQPFRLTDEQARFLVWWYAVDAQGRFLYRSGMLRRMKGWGKDPLGAALCCVEFVGPCRFGGWDANGEPIAVPHSAAWVQTAAVSRDQTRNTMTLFPGMMSPWLQAQHDIAIGKEIIYGHQGRCRIEAVTSSPRALEGGRATFILKNETHHWLTNNEGDEMSAVIARNAAKSRDASARVLAISNAHNPGEDSDAERDWEAWQKIAQGKSRATGFLYDSLEAPPDVVLADRDSLRAGILAARGDSYWLDVDRLIEEIYDPRTPPSTARRFYLNQIVAAEDAWVAPHEWDSRADTKRVVEKGALVALGFDGSKSDDHTALVACDIESGHLATLGVWDPEEHGGEIRREDIDAAVAQAFERFDVVAFYSDVHPWEAYIDIWSQRYGRDLCVGATNRNPIGWDMRGRNRDFTQAAEAFYEAVIEGQVTYDGHPVARQHVHNARRRPNQYGTTFGKEHRESSRKVDWLAAAVLAWKARQDYLALPENRRRRKRTGKAMFF